MTSLKHHRTRASDLREAVAAFRRETPKFTKSTFVNDGGGRFSPSIAEGQGGYIAPAFHSLESMSCSASK